MPTYFENWVKYYLTTSLLFGLVAGATVYFAFSCYQPPPTGEGWDGFGRVVYFAFCTQGMPLAIFFGSGGMLIITAVLDGIFRFVFKNTNPHRNVLVTTLILLILIIAGFSLLFTSAII